jgi:hypothetical protein
MKLQMFPIEGVSLSRKMFCILQSTLYSYEYKISFAPGTAGIRCTAVD